MQKTSSVQPTSTAEVARSDRATSDSSWMTVPKAIQLTMALRAGLPPTVTVPGYSDNNHLVFDAPGYYTVFGPGPAGGQRAYIYPSPASAAAWPSLTTGGTVTSGSRIGELEVTIGRRTEPVPTCNEGSIDRRITYSEGTIVDISNSSINGTSLISATGYRTDGSQVSVTLSESDSGGPLPMTATELAALAAADGLDISTAPTADQHRQAENKIIDIATGSETRSTTR